MELNENQKAVVTKYGFEMKDEPGSDWVVLDPIVRKANRGKGGRYVGGNLDVCLHQAVEARKVHDQSMQAAPPPKKKGAEVVELASKRKGKNKPVQEPQSEETPETGIEAPKPEEALPETLEEPASEPVTETPPSVGEFLETRHAASQEKGEDAEEEEDGFVETEDKPKRGRSKKAKEPKERKENRYMRAARVIAADLSIIEGLSLPRQEKKWDAAMKKLAPLAKMTEAGAGHSIEAWFGVTKVLAEHGWLTGPLAEITKDEAAS